MQVEERGRVAALVPERVHDVGRDGCERAGRCVHLLRSVRPQPELELAGENVEGVHVPVVDVGIRAALAGLVARPGRVDQLVHEEDADRALGPIGDRLALAGA